MDKKSLYITIGVIVVVIVGIASFIFILNKPGSLQPTQYPAVQTPAQVPTAPTIAEVPANAPVIVKAVISRSIDAKGNATGAATTFNTKTDKIVYAVLTLKNVTKNTKLSYVRYLNGKYVDSKVALPTKDGITTFYFAFEKGIGDYPKGTYTLKLYANGRYTQSLTYVFK